jgi:hypothetical protein
MVTGGSGKAEGLADGSIAFEKDHRQAVLAAATLLLWMKFPEVRRPN